MIFDHEAPDCIAHRGPVLGFAQKPKTVDEAVHILKTKWLKPKDLDWILRNPKEKVVMTLYRPFGTGVRNEFGLWGDNKELRESCGNPNPEGCSVVIFQRFWDSVREEADPALVRQLDCQFKLTHKIRVNLKGMNQSTVGYMITQLQKQIDSELASMPADEKCQATLQLETTGKPDLGCYVVAPHEKQQTEMPLDDGLQVLGLQVHFTPIHNPPVITLEFLRKCQFFRPVPF